jgi:hypothetical protein
MTLTSKIMGTLKTIFSFLWMGLGVLGIVYGLRGVSWLEVQLDSSLSVANQNIEIVNALLTEITDVIDKVDQALSIIENSTIDAGIGLTESRPIIDETSQIIIQDVPQALDEVQTSMPGVLEAAAMVDQTLSLLSSFQFAIPNPFGSNWEFNLGIDYDPPVTLQEALANLSGAIVEIPDGLRALEGDLVTADINMSVMSDNLINVAFGLDSMREQLADINPEIDRMVANLQGIQASVERTRTSLPFIARNARIGIVAILGLLILTQIPSAFTGYMMTRESDLKVDSIEGDD